MQSQTRRYTNDYPVLDLTALKREGLVKNGMNGKTSCKLHDCELWSFGWHCTSDNFKVSYKLTGGQIDGNYEHTIPIVKQSVNFGGERLFLSCPKCHSSRKQIYFVSGVAACRTCHGLHYKSQSESQQERKFRKLDRLLTKVDNFGYRFDGHAKPPYQHWRTFIKLNNQIHQVQQSIFADIDKRFGFGTSSAYF